MGNHFFRTIVAVVALLAAAAVVGQDSSKKEQQDPDEVARQKMETIQKEIAILRQQALRLDDQENSLLAQLSQYEVQYDIQTHEIEILEIKQETTRRDIGVLQSKYDQLKKDLEKQRQYLAARLVEAYKLGELNYLKLAVKVNQSTDLLRSYQYIAYLAKDDTRKVKNYRALMVDVEQTRLKLEQQLQNLDEVKTQLVAAHRALYSTRQEKRRLLASIRGEKTLHLTALSDLRTAEMQLRKLFIKPLTPPPTDNRPSLARLKGNLDWPVRGRITRHFGVYRHPRFGTTTMSNGVEIAAPQGSEVKAVYDGQVVFAEWFKGYGQSVILSHADGYYTLYAHNSELLVHRGQPVRRAQIIAKVGSTGALEGNSSLYFEVRKKDQPVNPIEWLRPR